MSDYVLFSVLNTYISENIAKLIEARGYAAIYLPSSFPELNPTVEN